VFIITLFFKKATIYAKQKNLTQKLTIVILYHPNLTILKIRPFKTPSRKRGHYSHTATHGNLRALASPSGDEPTLLKTAQCAVLGGEKSEHIKGANGDRKRCCPYAV
jgi:hypothetical protein